MRRINGVVCRECVVEKTSGGSIFSPKNCDTCGEKLPTGNDRPYCLKHSAYAQQVVVLISDNESSS